MYEFVSYLLRPYVLSLLLTGLAFIYLWRQQRERRRLRWLLLPMLALVVLSMPAVGYFTLGSLEWQHPPLEERPEDTEAIVLLGGGVFAPNRVRPHAELDPSSLYRTLHAAKLYRQGKPCLVLVSGGNPDPTVPGPPCSELMAELLVQQGVRPSDVLVENTSRTTFENAVESRKLLEERSIRRVVLVTEAMHLPRSVACFRKQGVEVVPSGSQYRATELKGNVTDFVPSVRALETCEKAAHEWVGLAWYRLAGRI